MKRPLLVATATILAAGAMPLNAAPMFVPKPEQSQVTLVDNVNYHQHHHYYHRPYYHGYYRPFYRPNYRLYYWPYYRPYYRPYHRPYYPGFYPHSGISLYFSF